MKYSHYHIYAIRSDVNLYLVFFKEIVKQEIVKKHEHKYVAVCPLHREDHPSFVVYKEGHLWFWRCFGCGWHGDIFKLVLDAKLIQETEYLGTDRFYESRAYEFRSIVKYIDKHLKK